MSQEAKDMRVKRSRKFLQEALVELIEDRGLDALTVGEITERAMVSRATFYRNYQDKYDLVEQVFGQAMEGAVKTISEMGHTPQAWEKFLEHLVEYERLYRALLGRKGSPWFVMKMRESMVNSIKSWQLASGQRIFPPSDDFVPDLVAAMFVEAITWWLENGRPYSVQEMNRRCVLLSAAIFKEAGTWK